MPRSSRGRPDLVETADKAAVEIREPEWASSRRYPGCVGHARPNRAAGGWQLRPDHKKPVFAGVPGVFGPEEARAH
jgi:hypothetical protein